MMKDIKLSEREIETIVGILSVEESDLQVIQGQLKRTGEKKDFEEVSTELAVISEILRKLKD